MNMIPSMKFRQKNPKRNGIYNIMPIENIPSVLEHGILSYIIAQSIIHKSVAMNIIQNKRDKVIIPNGYDLHNYANLYFDARNPMMFKRKNEDVLVLKIDIRIIDLPDVIISDQNASSKYARFYEPSEAIDKLDFSMIYSRDWNDSNLFMYYKKKSAKCAEILVPDRIDPKYIIAAAVRDYDDKKRIEQYGFDRKIVVEPDWFFM